MAQTPMSVVYMNLHVKDILRSVPSTLKRGAGGEHLAPARCRSPRCQTTDVGGPVDQSASSASKEVRDQMDG